MVGRTIAVLAILAGTALTISSSNFCTNVGVFPHPTDCTSFYTCHGSQSAGFKQQTHRCPTTMMFSKSVKQCVDLTEDPECEQEVLKRFDPYVSDPACDDQAVHCANCTHLVFCQLVGEEYQNPNYEDCAVSTMNAAPYCDTQMRTCTSQLPEGCQVPGFSCTSPGYFPDTKNCDVYHVCYDTVNYESFRCSDVSNPNYSSQEFRCSNNSVCEETFCMGTIGLVRHPTDPRYYLLCMSAGRSEIYICPGNTEFIDGAGGCQFQCHEEGVFPDNDNCYSYYRCEESFMGQYTQTNETCPGDLAFNPIGRICDAVENVKC